MHQALYRKWRPRVFDDVVGQEHITRTLRNEVAAGKPSHAYLFCGTRGTGKTTCSKILAKAVNCPDQKDGNPCCKCDICRGIDNDSILDVTEIDAASNSGVDNIRELREEANFTPTAARYRVYIIDETHMLSVGAFNALLKIMEEPPPHVLFILATTEIHKVPATILSRCQRFDFHRITPETIAARLAHIAGEEKVELEEEAALLIARLADGGMRDAINLLDLCISQPAEEGPVTAGAVMACAGLTGQDHLFQIGRAAADGDSGAVFTALESLWEQSVDYQRLCEQLIGFYRNLMIAKTVPNPRDFITCLPRELEEYQSLAGGMHLSRILSGLAVLQEALARMTRTAMRRTELEMALLKLCKPELDASPEALLARLEKLELAVKSGVAARRDTPAPEPAVQAPTPGKKQPVAKEVPQAAAPPVSKDTVEPFIHWGEVLDVLKAKNPPLFGALVQSNAYLGNGLLLVDPGENNMFAEMVRTDGYAKESLRDAVRAVTGKTYRLGPYSPEKYEIQSAGIDQLDAILTKASQLGADVQIKE